MKNVQKSNRRTLTGILFSLCVIYLVISLIRYGFGLRSILLLVGSALLAASMFVCNRKLLSLGAGIYLADAVVWVIKEIKLFSLKGPLTLRSNNGASVTLYDGAQNFVYLLHFCSALLMFLAWMVFLIATFKPKHGKLGVIAAVLLVLSYFVDRGHWIRYFGFGIYIIDPVDYFVYLIVLAISLALAGNVLSKGDLGTSPTRNTMTVQNEVSMNAESPLEKVAKLKGLLDAGIITQEEFDAKKKQLLGL